MSIKIRSPAAAKLRGIEDFSMTAGNRQSKSDAIGLPPGGLTGFLHAANECEQSALIHHAQLFQYIERARACLENVVAQRHTQHPIPAMLLSNCLALYLTSVRTALTGHLPPTFMVLRGFLESAVYAVIAVDHAEAWINRDNDIKTCRKLFTFDKGLKIISTDDPHLATLLNHSYQALIDLGAHPNVKSVVHHIDLHKRSQSGQHLSLTILHDADSNAVLQALVACIEMGSTVLMLTPRIFPQNQVATAAHEEGCKLQQEKQEFLIARGFSL